MRAMVLLRICCWRWFLDVLALLFALFCAYTAMAFGQGSPQLCGCPVLPPDNIWNAPVDSLPVDLNSAAYITTIGPTRGLHPDFGAGLWEGAPMGIPITVVSGSQPPVPISFEYGGESDPGPYPIPPDAAIEGGSQSTGDRHVLVLDRDRCILYETFSSYPQSDGSWLVGSGAVFDLLSNALRPAGWTSADAAGLPILPGLVRYDEVAAGEINHAIRFTVPRTRRAYVWPARHFASSLTGMQYPPMGQRFRLRSTFSLSNFSQDTQVILRALKRYGMILADNGSAWYITGAPDPGWDNDTLVNELARVKGSDFEAVDVSSLPVDPDSGQAAGFAGALEADLQLAVADDPDPVAFKHRLSYTITVKNLGPGSANAVRLTDTLPADCPLSAVWAESGAYTQWGPELVFQLGSLPPGATAQVTVWIHALAASTRLLQNTATVTAVEADPDPTNNQVETQTTVVSRRVRR